MVQGVVGVVTQSVPDVLCHAAVRARNSAVLLAACTDKEDLASIAALSGQQVVMQIAQVRNVRDTASGLQQQSCMIRTEQHHHKHYPLQGAYTQYCRMPYVCCHALCWATVFGHKSEQFNHACNVQYWH